MTLIRFDRADPEYDSWIEAHKPWGYVVNEETLMLHRSGCVNISARGGGSFEWQPKICGDKRGELEEWAAQREIDLQVCRNTVTVNSVGPSCATIPLKG